MPYKIASNNYQNILNEVISLLVSYFIVQINDHRYEPEAREVMGAYIVNLIYFSWVSNLGIVVTVILLELRLKCRRKYYMK